MSVTMDFLRVGSNVYKIGFDFPACHGGLAKYQICWIFHQPSLTLDADRGSAHLETGLSCLSMSCHSHFQTCPILLPSCQKTLASLS